MTCRCTNGPDRDRETWWWNDDLIRVLLKNAYFRKSGKKETTI